MTTQPSSNEAVEAAMKYATNDKTINQVDINLLYDLQNSDEELEETVARILAAEVERLCHLTTLAPDTDDDSLYNVRRLRVELAQQIAEVERLKRENAELYSLACKLHDIHIQPMKAEIVEQAFQAFDIISAKLGKDTPENIADVMEDAAKIIKLHDIERELCLAQAEIEKLRSWKDSAMNMLSDWDAVWETAGQPGTIGCLKSAATQKEVARLRTQADAVAVLKNLEWSAIYSYCTGWPCCPVCRGIKPGWGADEQGNLPLNQGHRKSCALAKAIGAADTK